MPIRAVHLAWLSAGSSRLMSSAMIATTTRSSMSVNAAWLRGACGMRPPDNECECFMGNSAFERRVALSTLGGGQNALATCPCPDSHRIHRLGQVASRSTSAVKRFEGDGRGERSLFVCVGHGHRAGAASPEEPLII